MEHGNFIANEWVAAAATRPVIDTATGAQLATVAESSAADVATAIRAAREA